VDLVSGLGYDTDLSRKDKTPKQSQVKDTGLELELEREC
jgi:hypothetical protein